MVKQEAKMSTPGQNATRVKRAKTRLGRRWVVAVDPYSDLNFKPVMEYSRALSEAAGAELLGTYILAPESLNWMGEFSGPWLKRYRPVAQAKADEIGQQLGLNIEVVPSRHPGLNQSADTLIRYCKKIKAECIVLCTHARTGLERWMLGSYAETVILSSPIPVLVVNPALPLPLSLPSGATRILAPTDLGAQSGRFLARVGEFASRIGAEINLFYKKPDPLDPMIQQGVYAVGGGWVTVQNHLDQSIKEMRAKLDLQAERLNRQGAPTTVMIDEGPSALVESIEKSALEKHASLIAALTQSGPVAATLLGSVARSLVRTSPVPVMIFR